jgi:hypothetical protein
MTLYEAEYKDFFSKQTLANLKGKSAQSLQQMVKGDIMSAMRRSSKSLKELMEIEKPFRRELEMLAEVMVRDVYGMVGENQIKIEAKLVPSVNMSIEKYKEEDEAPEEMMDDTFPDDVKRRIINSLTQGGAIRGSFSFFLFKEYLDDINPRLVEKYDQILNDSYGIYDDDNAIAMMLQMLSQGGGQGATAGGMSQGYFDENADQFVVKAEALIFPILVQEIIKGVYEIVAQEGFSRDLETNKKIMKRVDKVPNEPEDIRYGKFIFDAVNNLVADNSTNNDNRTREYFLAEVYKLEDVEFLQFVENLINDKLTSTQKSWAVRTIRDIEDDLKRDDTGLTGLDYNPDDDDEGSLV